MNKDERKEGVSEDNSSARNRNEEAQGNQALSQIERRRQIYATFGYNIEKEREAVIQVAGELSGRILEAGTGKGHFAAALASRGHRLVSFDISEEQLEIARENLASRGLAHLVELRKEDGERLSFPDSSFDLIFSVNMVHHLENPWKVISELIRVLAPGGKLVISDFSQEGLEMMDKVHRLEGGKHEVGPAGLDQVEEFLKGKGFQVERSSTRFQVTLVAVRK
ncbi:MAG: class I SAM-dependent methyltransferase [Candidatus Saccharicenans sp.]|nr:class I SAM-dependent methyltransferase [Candidatus Saccharicenans sp.]